MPRTIRTSGDYAVDRELDALWHALDAIKRLEVETAAVTAAVSAVGVEAIGIDGAQGLQGVVTLGEGQGIDLSQSGQRIEVAAAVCDVSASDVGYSSATKTYDDFAEVVSDLASHTMDTGETYSRQRQYGDFADRVIRVDATGAYSAGAPYSDYYTVSRDFGNTFTQRIVIEPGSLPSTSGNTWGSVALVARQGATGYQEYTATWTPYGSLGTQWQVILSKFVSGILTYMMNVRGYRVPQAGDQFMLEVAPGVQRVYVNGTLAAYSSDTAISPTHAAFYLSGIDFGSPYYPTHATYYEIEPRLRRTGGYAGTSSEMSRCDHVHDGVYAVRFGYEHGTSITTSGDVHLDIDGGLDATMSETHGYVALRNAWRRSFLIG